MNEPYALSINHLSKLYVEDESTFLAEYGTSGPYDNLLHFPDTSKSVFTYGGKDIFLTGANTLEEENENIILSETSQQLTHHVDPTWPMECIVMHHTNIISSTTAESLWDGVHKVLNETELNVDVNSNDVKCVNALTGNENVDNFLIPHPLLNKASDNEFINTLDKLLQEADMILTRPKPFVDPMSQESIIERQRAIEEEEKRWSPINKEYLFNESENESDSDFYSIKEDNNKEKEVEELTEKDKNSNNISNSLYEIHKKELKPLFEYEFEPTVEEKNTLQEWDEAVAKCEKREEISMKDIFNFETIENINNKEEKKEDNNRVKSHNDLKIPKLIYFENNEKKSPLLSSLEIELSTTSQVSKLEEHAIIINSIANMETRDCELQAMASKKFENFLQKQKYSHRNIPGNLVFDSFVKRVDELLPPNEIEIELRTAVTLDMEENNENKNKNKETVKRISNDNKYQELLIEKQSLKVYSRKKILSVDQIKKRAERDNFIVKFAANEARKMQEEDMKMMRELQYLEDEEKRFKDIIIKFLQEENIAYENILKEEISFYQNLCIQKEQELLKIKQIEVTKKEKNKYKLINELINEYTSIRFEIIYMEEKDSNNILNKWQNEKDFIYNKRQKKIDYIYKFLKQYDIVIEDENNNNIEKFLSEKGNLINSTENTWKRFISKKEIKLSKRNSFNFPITNSLRLESLKKENYMGIKWLKECKQEIINTSNSISECLHSSNDNNILQTTTSMPSSRPGTASSFSSTNGIGINNNNNNNSLNDTVSSVNSENNNNNNNNGICLDAKLAKELQPFIFRTIKSDVRDIIQLSHTVSFALEHITSINFPSLASLEVCIGTGNNNNSNSNNTTILFPLSAPLAPRLEKRNTFITPFIREIDLGGNALTSLSLDDLLRVFPSLLKLNISDNKLQQLTIRAAFTRGISEANINSLAQSTHLSQVNIALNNLQSIEAIGKLLSYHLRILIMYSNKIESLLPLISCTLLESLEASRNKISSLSELQHLRVLQTIDVSENNISNWDSLSQHILLQNLYLSRNKIQVLPKILSLTFLRKLFINENKLENFPSECFYWLPLLSVLHLDNNYLHDISGISYCPRLTCLSISFNQLKKVDDLLPLTACKKLQTLSIIENPFTKNNENQEEDNNKILINIKQKLFIWFPNLCELNNEKVTEIEKRDTTKEEFNKYFYNFSKNRKIIRQRNENIFYYNIYYLNNYYLTNEDIQREYGFLESYIQYFNPIYTYINIFTALINDIILTNIQTEQDILSTSRRRHFHDAIHIEEELQKKLRKSKKNLNPIIHRLSDKVEERNRRDNMILLQNHLNKIQEIPKLNANIHIKSTLYYEKMQAYKESKAKVIICNWLYLRLLSKNAKKELEILKEIKKEKQRQQYEDAVRIIQPIWRGAALRSRLKRILHSNNDNDDDEEFKHVSMNFLDDASNNIESITSGLTSALQSVLQAHGSLPNFPIVPSPGRSTRVENNINININNMSGRPSSAAQLTQLSKTSHFSEERESRGRPESQPNHISHTEVKKENGNEEWGALVNSQIRKKQKKMERAHRENLQREFMKDPLKVKREMGKR